MRTSTRTLARPGIDVPDEHRVNGTRSLVLLMLLTVAAVALLAFWDEQRESAAALDDFAQEQATLASSVASELATRLAGAQARGRATPSIELLLEGATRVERPGMVRVLVLEPGDPYLRGTDGGVFESAPVLRALAAEQTSAWLDRREAAALGLPPRRAAAGLVHIDAGQLGRWAVAVVTSGERLRDREQRAAWRLTLGVLLAAGLVFVFGSAALRRQRRGMLLERELALAALARERDGDLATASRAATLGTLAMGIAHEVSTPLGVISGRAEQSSPRSPATSAPAARCAPSSTRPSASAA